MTILTCLHSNHFYFVLLLPHSDVRHGVDHCAPVIIYAIMARRRWRESRLRVWWLRNNLITFLFPGSIIDPIVSVAFFQRISRVLFRDRASHVFVWTMRLLETSRKHFPSRHRLFFWRQSNNSEFYFSVSVLPRFFSQKPHLFPFGFLPPPHLLSAHHVYSSYFRVQCRVGVHRDLSKIQEVPLSYIHLKEYQLKSWRKEIELIVNRETRTLHPLQNNPSLKTH